MKTNTEYASKKAQSEIKVVNAKLCFENLRCTDYRKGYLITESNLAQEKEGSPIRELGSFANLIVDNCNINESDNSSIYVSVIVNSKEKMQRLYEWIEKYAGKDKVNAIAPNLLEALDIEDGEKLDEENSVATRFAKYRKLYEDAEVSEDDSVSEGDDDEKTDDKPADEPKEDDKEDDKKDDEDTDDEEQDELTAVILEVKKGDEDKLKDELIEAGVDEDDIEIITEEEDNEDEEGDENSEEKNEEDEAGEDENKDEDKDETVKVKVAVDSFDALKEYLEGKGFNLEEELGGEIVSDDSEEGEGDDKEGDEKEDDGGLDAEFDGFDDLFK